MGFFGWLFLYIVCGFTTVFFASILERYTQFKFGFLNSVQEPVSGSVGVAFFLWWLVSFFGLLYISWTLIKYMSVHIIKSDDPWGTKSTPYVIRGKIPPLPEMLSANGNETLVAKLRNALGPVYTVADIVQMRQKTLDLKKIEKLDEIIIKSADQAMDTKDVVMELLTQIEEENEQATTSME